jgi:hypothetical protein
MLQGNWQGRHWLLAEERKVPVRHYKVQSPCDVKVKFFKHSSHLVGVWQVRQFMAQGMQYPTDAEKKEDSRH